MLKEGEGRNRILVFTIGAGEVSQGGKGGGDGEGGRGGKCVVGAGCVRAS